MPDLLTITLDRAAGTAVMAKGSWQQVLPIAGLRAQLRFYRQLWSRKPKGTPDEKTPGPWAGFYAEDVREAENG